MALSFWRCSTVSTIKFHPIPNFLDFFSFIFIMYVLSLFLKKLGTVPGVLYNRFPKIGLIKKKSDSHSGFDF